MLFNTRFRVDHGPFMMLSLCDDIHNDIARMLLTHTPTVLLNTIISSRRSSNEVWEKNVNVFTSTFNT